MTLVGIHGGVTVDHIVTAPRGARFSCLGGPALFAALGARLVAGTDVRLAAELPAVDPRFATLFTAVGIDLAFATTVRDVPRLWILNSGRGRRIVSLAPNDIEIEAGPGAAPDGREDPAGPPSGFVAGLDGLLASNPIRRPSADADSVVGVDPDQVLLARQGYDYLDAVVTARTVLLPSRVQLRLCDPDPLTAAREWSRRYRVPVVARLDAEGMHVFDGAQHWALHDPAVMVLETTGAGDSSASAIVASLAAGADPVDSARMGMSVARLALSRWGHEGLVAEPLHQPFPEIRTRKVETHVS
ncbi:PfkB family carbohydrate kinase [Tessaracoccus lapidicaptus]|uniref:PfkB family carbohydrate kinase n=1 Tax=Tessaracoccus lapidicaptus TaxID=1427523 RepID=UPI003342936C